MFKIFLFCLVTLLSGCGCVTNTRTPEEVSLVTAVSEASKRAEELLARAYEEQAIAAVRGAESQEEALERLADVDLIWEPVWVAWADLREAYDNCLLSTQTCDLNVLAYNWCALELQAARRGVKLPHVLNCVP